MSKAIITIKFLATPDHRPGDYAQLYSNGGDGDIDWNTPVSSRRHPLYPGDAGQYGFGRTPFGRTPFGHGQAIGVNTGFGHGPFGRTPFGHGATVVTATHAVTACGMYKYGIKTFDAAGNENEGTPAEETLSVHVTPPRATPLKPLSYDKATDILILEVA